MLAYLDVMKIACCARVALTRVAKNRRSSHQDSTLSCQGTVFAKHFIWPLPDACTTKSGAPQTRIARSRQSVKLSYRPRALS